MRASKEEADAAIDRLNVIREQLGKHTLRATVERLSEFLNAAKRKLPTEAAYKRESLRRAVKDGR